MGVRKRKRSDITVRGRLFLWWAGKDEEEAYFALTVISEDKRFHVRYHLNLPDPDRRYIIVIGKEFPGLPEAGGHWIRVRCPRWDISEPITPRFVRRLIEWCLFANRQLERVDYIGKPIEEFARQARELRKAPVYADDEKDLIGMLAHVWWRHGLSISTAHAGVHDPNLDHLPREDGTWQVGFTLHRLVRDFAPIWAVPDARMWRQLLKTALAFKRGEVAAVKLPEVVEASVDAAARDLLAWLRENGVYPIAGSSAPT